MGMFDTVISQIKTEIEMEGVSATIMRIEGTLDYALSTMFDLWPFGLGRSTLRE